MSDRHANIAGTRILIVGASSGIGHALALAAHSRGAKVALAARRIDRLGQLATLELEQEVRDFPPRPPPP